MRVQRCIRAWPESSCRLQVDQLLAVQFQEDMNRLVQHCGRRAQGGRQTLLVSATLTPKVGLTTCCCCLADVRSVCWCCRRTRHRTQAETGLVSIDINARLLMRLDLRVVGSCLGIELAGCSSLYPSCCGCACINTNGPDAGGDSGCCLVPQRAAGDGHRRCGSARQPSGGRGAGAGRAAAASPPDPAGLGAAASRGQRRERARCAFAMHPAAL